MDFPSTYTLAHTARCKLQLAADRPDRDLRFILGHAFTLDKLRLRLAEIEVSSNDDQDAFYEDDGHDHPTCTGNVAAAPAAEPHQLKRQVSFTNNSRPAASPHRHHSPPPADQHSESDSDSVSSDEEDYEDINEEELGLTRFASAAAAPPREMPDLEDDEDGDDDRDVAEPRSPTDDELRLITGGDGNAELKDAYSHIAGCPCHNVGAEKVEKVWELPSKGGMRVAVVQVVD